MDFYILMLANLIGAASLAGWLVAWAKLDGRIKKPWRFRGQRFYNALVLLAALAIGTYIVVFNSSTGLAAGLEGLVLQNPAIMIAGVVLGSAGTLLTLRMARTMSVTDVIVPKQPRHARGAALLRQPRREQPV
jgi:NAD(P) transhydrogenase subunit beta